MKHKEMFKSILSPSQLSFFFNDLASFTLVESIPQGYYLAHSPEAHFFSNVNG